MTDEATTCWVWVLDLSGSGSTSGGADTLTDALQAAFTEATYYFAMGYPTVVLRAEQQCRPCGGSGKVIKKRGTHFHQWKKCPACRGKGVLQTMGDMNLRPHPSVADAVVGACK